MKSIIPSIFVENCSEALEYYKGIFGGELKNVQKADGIKMFQGHEGKIIHAELHINENCVLYFVDYMDGEKTEERKVDLVIEMDSEEEINRVYSELSKNSSIIFELQKTFWGAFHSVLTDKYGVTWGLNYTSR